MDHTEAVFRNRAPGFLFFTLYVFTSSKGDLVLKKTPLYDKHIEFGARMVSFSGWKMPLQYSGIIVEHCHTREKAGLFDTCHMGRFLIRGKGCVQALEKMLTCGVGDMRCGKCRYGFLLNDNGGIIDDLIVFRFKDNEYMMVVNAGSAEKDRKWIKSRISGDVRFFDDSVNTAKLDIQGPLSGRIVSEAFGIGIEDEPGRFSFRKIDFKGIDVVLSRTGYTGEDGYEIFFPAEHSVRFWDILTADKDIVKPVGLGARDTLRLEMGYSLYGSDLDEEHTPLESNLSRFVLMDKDFTGKEALLKQINDGVGFILKGFVAEGRRSARHGFKVFCGGKEAGRVTSGAFSPCLKKAVGLCYIDRRFSGPGTEIELSEDGRVKIPARISETPFLER